ncbi:MAG TPA: electron transfer flavoprotein subunit alpha/FixB family protein [Syntrophomonas sp.]|nr:electron transfer flavoprotein subunit alpha/FixB family protein [Syntrophomonas sp.]
MSNDSWIIIADDVPIGSLPAMARSLDGQVTAVVVGSRERAETVAVAGVDALVWYTTDDETPVEAWATVIAEAAAEAKPRVVLAANAPGARVIVGAVAARLGAAITSSVMAVTLEEERVAVKRSVAEGRAVEVLDTDGCVAGLIIEGGDEAELSSVAVAITAAANVEPGDSLKVAATHVDTGGGAELASADRVVGVGLGLGARDNLALVEKLAIALRAELACTLPLCDDYRWFEHSRVVGSSTQRISPRFYLAVGISGQPQHMMGVRGVKTIVAINNDPEAPIFGKCTYGIVGDLNAVVPALTAALSKS